jgi:putative transposase
MPRTARLIHPEVAVHITQRGNNRSRCFFTDSDYLAYLRFLREFSVVSNCAVHAYCLMTNHVHLLVTPQTRDGCAMLMKGLGQHYVQHVNRVHGRTGTLWEGRFWSSISTSEYYVLACHRYIELNPVRAGLASRPEDYAWSSFGCNALGREDSLVEPHPAYLALSVDTHRRRLAYRSLFEYGLEPTVINEIRRAARGGRPMGAPRKTRGRPPAQVAG